MLDEPNHAIVHHISARKAHPKSRSMVVLLVKIYYSNKNLYFYLYMKFDIFTFCGLTWFFIENI